MSPMIVSGARCTGASRQNDAIRDKIDGTMFPSTVLIPVPDLATPMPRPAMNDASWERRERIPILTASRDSDSTHSRAKLSRAVERALGTIRRSGVREMLLLLLLLQRRYSWSSTFTNRRANFLVEIAVKETFRKTGLSSWTASCFGKHFIFLRCPHTS